MDHFLGTYRGHRIYEVRYVEDESSGEFRVEGFSKTYLSLAAAQQTIDEVLAKLEPAQPDWCEL